MNPRVLNPPNNGTTEAAFRSGGMVGPLVAARSPRSLRSKTGRYGQNSTLVDGAETGRRSADRQTGHGKRENGTSLCGVDGHSDRTPAVGASIAYPPNPLGTFSTTSRCTTLPFRGTTRYTARPGPDQRHVRTPIVRNHFDPSSHVPADFTTPVGLVHVLGIAAGLEFVPVLAQHVRFDYRGPGSFRNVPPVPFGEALLTLPRLQGAPSDIRSSCTSRRRSLFRRFFALS